MKKLRYRYVAMALAMAGAADACAQTYPNRPIRLVVALAAGGPTDVVARIFASRLGELLGQQVVVDNRPGAGGSVGGEIAAKAPPDGHTLFAAANGTIAIAPNLFAKLPFDVSRDLTPVVLIGNSPLALMTHPSLPAKSVKELVALAKARPGTINYGSSGTGTTAHLACELFRMAAAVDIVHIPYKGAAPALVGVISGEVALMISGVAAGLPHIRQNQVRALGVTSTKRVALLPEVPTVAETLPGYEVGSWYAVLTTAGTPRAIVERLTQESIKAIGSPDIQAKLIAASVDPEPLGPEQLGEKIRTETARWGKVVKAAGIKRQ
jgi:tripartite-type tricarboxylate transporter receptor subunit TctC